MRSSCTRPAIISAKVERVEPVGIDVSVSLEDAIDAALAGCALPARRARRTETAPGTQTRLAAIRPRRWFRTGDNLKRHLRL
jgi:hypothetical protein